MRSQRKIEKRSNIPLARGNGQIHYELWIDEAGNITRYNLAYINHRFFAKDNGRVVGYDNAHGSHHRHFMGTTEPVDLVDFDDIEASFIRDWQTFLEGESQMKQLVIKVESMRELLAWSRELARKIDNGEPIPETCVVSYQEPEELLAVFTAGRRKLLDVIVQQAGTVDDIAARAGCDLAEADEDIAVLLEAGVITLEGNVVSAIADSVVYEPVPHAAFQA